MDQTRKTVAYGYEDSTDIEMSLPDVLAIVKRLGKLRAGTWTDNELSDQPDCESLRGGKGGAVPRIMKKEMLFFMVSSQTHMAAGFKKGVKGESTLAHPSQKV